MFKKHVLRLLERYLGEYVHGPYAEDFKISVLKGDVVLKDLKLKAEALNSLKLPVTVKAGFVGTITLKFPWKSLGKEPMSVLIDRVFILAHPKPEPDWFLKEEDRDPIELQQIESSPGNSWLGSLIAIITGNLKISISNVHVRYEDDISNPEHPFSCGVTLEKLVAVTMDEQGNEIFDTSGALDKLCKSVQLERLAVYHDSNHVPWKLDKGWEDLSPKEWIEISEGGISEVANGNTWVSVWSRDRNFLVSPINGELEYRRLGNQERNVPNVPFEKTSVVITNVSLSITEAQYHDWIRLMEVISRYKTYVSENARYAVQAGLQQKKMRHSIVGERLTEEAWQAINKLLSYQADEDLALHPKKKMQNVIRVDVSIVRAAAWIFNIDNIEIACGRFENLHVSTKFRHQSTRCNVTLKLYDLSAPEGSLAQSVVSEQEVNALSANFVHLSTGKKIGWSLSATISRCHVTVFMESYNRFLDVLKRSNAVSPTTALQHMIDKVTRRAREQFQSRFDLDINLDALKVRVPIRTAASSICDCHLLLDFGHFTLSNKDDDWSYDRGQSPLYCRFFICGRDIAAFFSDCGFDTPRCSLASQPSTSPNLQDVDSFYSLIDRCRMAIIIDQIKVPHPSHPSTRVSIQMPTLSIHFSPSRYGRLMELLNILYGTMETSKQPAVESLHANSAPWNPSDRILVWQGIGYSVVLSDFYYHNLESEASHSFQRCSSMAGKQVLEVSSTNVGSLSCVAHCVRGVDVQKALESFRSLIIPFPIEEEKAVWMRKLVQTTYEASLPYFSWRDTDALPPAPDQIAGTCWAEATAITIRCYYQIHGPDKKCPLLAVRYLVNSLEQGYIHNVLGKSSPKCPEMVFEFVMREGIPSATDYAFQRRHERRHERRHMDKYYVSDYTTTTDMIGHKERINEAIQWAPITGSMYMYSSFIKFKFKRHVREVYEPYHKERGKKPGHCFLIIGFGQDVKGVEFFQILNSHGPTWGCDGIANIRRDLVVRVSYLHDVVKK